MPKVLIVDNDKSLTLALSVRLLAAGFEVHTANNAHDASKVALRERPDLIVLDIDMPSYSGIELHQCFQFSERAKDIPVVYLSGRDSATDRRAAVEHGAKAFIAKPYDAEVLISTLHTILERRPSA
ncbi:MAG: response regulator [Phycisphaerales bacterium]|nr:MAG: response regulator [Phycisphaerales bacterium]